MLNRYPLDPTGLSSENLIRNESHTFEVDQETPIILTRGGCYFGESLMVKHGQEILVKGKDYQLALFYQDATLELGQDIYAGVHLLRPDFLGTLTLDYQVVGGKYFTPHENYIEMIKHPPKDIHRIHFDDIVGVPAAFIPVRHAHDIRDIHGLYPIVIALEELRQTLIKGNAVNLKHVYDRFLKLKQYVESLTAKLDDASQAYAEFNRQLEERLAEIPSVSQMESMITEKLTGVKQQVIDALSETINNINNDITTLTNQVTNLDNRVTEQSTALQQTQQQLDNTNTTLTQRIDTLESTQQQDKQGLEERLTQQKAEIEETFRAELGEKESEITRRVETIQGDLQGNINAVSNTVEANKLDTDNRLTEMQRQLDVNQQQFTNKQTQDKEELLNLITENAQHDSEAKQELTNLVNNTSTSLNEKVTQLTDRINDVESAHAISEETNARQLQQVQETLTEKIDQNKTNVDEQLAALGQRVDNVTTTLEANHTQQMDALTSQLENQFNTLSSAVTNQLSHVDQVLTTQQESVEQRLTALSHDNDENIAELLAKITTNTDEINTLKQNVNNSLTRIESTIQNKVTEGNRALASKVETLRLRTDEQDTSIEGLRNATEGLWDKQTTITQDVERLKSSNTNVSQTVSNLSTTIQGMNTTLTQRANELSNTLTQLTSNVSGLTTALAQQPDLITQAISDHHTSVVIPLIDSRLQSAGIASQSELDKVKGSLTNISANQTQLQNAINTLGNTYVTKETHTHDIDALQGSVDNCIASIGNLNQTVSQDIGNLRNTLSTQISQVNNLSSSQINLTNRVANNENAITDLTTKSTQASQDITQLQQQDTTLTNEINALQGNVTTLTEKVNPLTEKVSNHEDRITVLEGKGVSSADLTAINNRLDSLNAQCLDIGSTLSFKQDRLQDAVNSLKANGMTEERVNNIVNGRMHALSSEIDDAKHLANTAIHDVQTLGSTVYKLEQKVNEVPPPPSPSMNQEDVKRVVSQVIAEMQIQPESKINPDDLIIHPDSPGTVITHPDGSLTVSGIVYMHEDVSHDEQARHVFTPNTVLEWTTNDTWVVPDAYDYLIAQVWVTAGVRQGETVNGKLVYHTPSTKMCYVMLKARETIKITVGSISSFGRYVTNDGVTTNNLIIPSIPIITSSLDLGQGHSLKEIFGTGGKVLIHV